MNRRDMIQRLLFGGTILILLPASLNSCSKDEKEEKKKTFTIDLTDPKYSALTLLDHTFIIGSLNIIIVKHHYPSEAEYIAADAACSSCGSEINYLTGYSDPPWKCSGCKTGFGLSGNIVSGSSIVVLKTYPVNRSGNILTITIR